MSENNEITQDSSTQETNSQEAISLSVETLKSIGAVAPKKARRIFFSWENPDTGEVHPLSVYYRPATFGTFERIQLASKKGDFKGVTDILADCLFVDEDAKKKLFTAKQLQEELHASFTTAIILAVESAQKKRS